MREGNHSLRLNEARELTPPVNPVEAMRRQLATALFGAVGEKDVLDVASKLKEMALAGNLKAMQMFFALMLPKEEKAAPPPPPADSAGLKMMAEAMRDLVDEIRVTRARQDRQPLPALNGKGD